MQIIPVIDIQGGAVVQADGGHRRNYRPINSTLVEGHDPLKIGSAICQRIEPSAIYVADLDALGHGSLQIDTIQQLGQLICKLWLDAGVRSASFDELTMAVEPLAQIDIVLASETVDDPKLIDRALATWGAERVMVSLDLRHGNLLTACHDWAAWPAVRLATALTQQGIRRLIILDTARCGQGQGCTTIPLVREMKRLDKELFVATGGGIRDRHDLAAVAQTGCDAVLVATAIHLGSITDANFPR